MKHSTLHNQQIVIIGGTSGLGLATAQQAIEQGAKVIIGGSSREQLATALAELGPNASGHQLDILDVDSVNHFFSQLDSLDHLVITAAVMRPGSFLTAAIEDLKINMDSRFWGSVHAIRAAASKLSERGSIVLTSGMVTRRPQLGKALPAVAAGAVETLAHSLVTELTPRRINVINPGPMRTPMLLKALGNDPQKVAAVAQSLPLKRLGEGEDYAQAALFLMSNNNMNGEVLHLNGGSAWA
ncbi:SDR family oxidoreductase [Aeromonas veronii]|uniref:SDR family oxidoreductase n=1 Tax=Aeromonas veronii TaxID=654 RepID=UPI0005A9C729|nr:SDR family oxidoreductase [Aeromonas veronii]